MYHILIAGAGYTGSAIARDFAARKQKVYALTRSREKAQSFETEGILPLRMDITRPQTLQGLPPAHFIVLAVAPDQRDEESYRRIYVEGVGHLLKAIRGNPRPFLVVYLSSSAVWGDQKGGWVDESTAPSPDTERGRILLEAENQVLTSGLPAVIFRLAGIYGPGRNRLSIMNQSAAAPARPQWMNMIHVEDIVAAMPLLFNKAGEGAVYAGVDDEPVASPDFYSWLAGAAGCSVPFQFSSEPAAGKRIKNAGLKTLGFQCQYTSFREGYAEILKLK